MNRNRWTLAVFLLLLSMWVLSGCSDKATRKLKRSARLEKEAIALGAKVTADTVYKPVQVFVPQVKTDTVFESKQGDTVLIEKERLKIKYVNLPKDSVYIYGECEADTVIQKVPYTVTKKISAGYTKWEFFGTLFVAAVVFLVIGMFVQGMRR